MQPSWEVISPVCAKICGAMREIPILFLRKGRNIGQHDPYQPYWCATQGPNLLWELATGLGTQADCHRRHLWKEGQMGRFIYFFAGP